MFSIQVFKTLSLIKSIQLSIQLGGQEVFCCASLKFIETNQLTRLFVEASYQLVYNRGISYSFLLENMHTHQSLTFPTQVGTQVLVLAVYDVLVKQFRV